MRMTPEAKVKADLKRFLNALWPDCWYFCPMTFGYGRSGVPDFIGCYKGKFFAVEAKAPGKESTPWQHREQAGIIAARGLCWVVDDVDEDFKKDFLDALQ